MAEEFDEQGNPIVPETPPEPDPAMAGRLADAEAKLKDYDDLRAVGCYRDSEGRVQKFAPEPVKAPPVPAADPLDEPIPDEILYDPAELVKEMARRNKIQTERAVNAAVGQVHAFYQPIADRVSKSTIKDAIPDYDEIHEEFDALLAEKKVSLAAIIGDEVSLKDAADIARGRRFAAGKYNPVPPPEPGGEDPEETRRRMIAGGAASSGGAGSAKNAGWGDYQPSALEIQICKEDNLTPAEYFETYGSVSGVKLGAKKAAK